MACTQDESTRTRSREQLTRFNDRGRKWLLDVRMTASVERQSGKRSVAVCGGVTTCTMSGRTDSSRGSSPAKTSADGAISRIAAAARRIWVRDADDCRLRGQSGDGARVVLRHLTTADDRDAYGATLWARSEACRVCSTDTTCGNGAHKRRIGWLGDDIKCTATRESGGCEPAARGGVCRTSAPVPASARKGRAVWLRKY